MPSFPSSPSIRDQQPSQLRATFTHTPTRHSLPRCRAPSPPLPLLPMPLIMDSLLKQKRKWKRKGWQERKEKRKVKKRKKYSDGTRKDISLLSRRTSFHDFPLVLFLPRPVVTRNFLWHEGFLSEHSPAPSSLFARHTPTPLRYFCRVLTHLYLTGMSSTHRKWRRTAALSPLPVLPFALACVFRSHLPA